MRLIRFAQNSLLALALSFGSASAHLVASSYSLKGGEKFTPGQKVKVTFTIHLKHFAIDLDFSKDGGVTYETLIRDLPPGANDMPYNIDWTVPNTPTIMGRVRVFQHEEGHPRMLNTDLWNLVSPNFTIEAAPTSIITPLRQSTVTSTLTLSHGKISFNTHNPIQLNRAASVDALGHPLFTKPSL